MQGVEGVHRFLQRTWRMIVDQDTGGLAEWVEKTEADEATLRLLNQTIKKVGNDIESFGFNTAISAMMIFVNHLSKKIAPESTENTEKAMISSQSSMQSVVEKFVLILAPFAPHIAEELWEKLGHTDTLAYRSWPEYDKELVKEKEVELAVQVNGKIRDRIVVAVGADEQQIKEKALSSERVVSAMAGKPPEKIIVIKSRLVNIVVT
jgi:leucyl-tRNA synthetase